MQSDLKASEMLNDQATTSILEKNPHTEDPRSRVLTAANVFNSCEVGWGGVTKTPSLHEEDEEDVDSSAHLSVAEVAATSPFREKLRNWKGMAEKSAATQKEREAPQKKPGETVKKDDAITPPLALRISTKESAGAPACSFKASMYRPLAQKSQTHSEKKTCESSSSPGEETELAMTCTKTEKDRRTIFNVAELGWAVQEVEEESEEDNKSDEEACGEEGAKTGGYAS